MANLRPPARSGERGQLILITAFILALSFVVLALVVNSAIFTENLSTRDDVAGSQDSLQHRQEVQRNVGEIITAVNEDSSLGIAAAENSVANISTQTGLQQASQGRIVNVSHVNTEGGMRIAQHNATRNFTSNNSVSDWRVAQDVTDTRNFVINVTNPDDSSLDFIVRVNDTTPSPVDDWVMRIENVGGDDVAITVRSSGGVATESCLRRNVGDSVNIDVTAATFAGEPCPALERKQEDGTPLWFGADVGTPYHIDFERPGTVEGTYSMVVDDGALVDSSNYGSDQSRFPFVEDSGVIYSMTVNYAYYTQSVGYETQVRAAPGEVPP